MTREKEAAARASLQFVRDGDIVGLGTGSTAAYAVRFLGERVQAGLKIRGIPTSVHTQELAASLGIPLTTLDEVQEIDVTIDGADECRSSTAIDQGRGRGAAAGKNRGLSDPEICDHRRFQQAGSGAGQFSGPGGSHQICRSSGGEKDCRSGRRGQSARGSSGRKFITDEGNHILDCNFGQIPDPPALARELESMPGVVEHGLFIGMAAWR